MNINVLIMLDIMSVHERFHLHHTEGTTFFFRKYGLTYVRNVVSIDLATAHFHQSFLKPKSAAMMADDGHALTNSFTSSSTTFN